MIIESGPSLSVLGDLQFFFPFCSIVCRFVSGLREALVSTAEVSSMAVDSGSGSCGLGLPDIMLAQSASTSTVAVDVSASGLFSTFLHHMSDPISKEPRLHTLVPSYSSS